MNKHKNHRKSNDVMKRQFILSFSILTATVLIITALKMCSYCEMVTSTFENNTATWTKNTVQAADQQRLVTSVVVNEGNDAASQRRFKVGSTQDL